MKITKGTTTLVCGRVLEWLLYLTIGANILGHVVNRLTSPAPLNPLWNRISAFAASGYGGYDVTAGIWMFALSLLLFGMLARIGSRTIILEIGSLIMSLSSIPVVLVAVFPTFIPRGEIMNGRRSQPGWIARTLYPTLTERMSDHWHNVSLVCAFTMMVSGIVLLSTSFLRVPTLRPVGQAGLVLAPVLIVLLKMAYNSGFYNGTWQRLAFLFLITWIWSATLRLRRASSLRVFGVGPFQPAR